MPGIQGVREYVYPLDSRVGPGEFVYAASGIRWPAPEVMASLNGDTSLFCWITLPPTDPTGTLRCVLRSGADVDSNQDAKLRILWAPLSPTDHWGTTPRHDEHSGGDLTISHAVADDYTSKRTVVDLDATTVTYGTHRDILLEIAFKTIGWSLAVPWYIFPELEWS